MKKESRNRVLTLYYHRVNSLENDYNLLCVSPMRFRQQMLYLKNKYQIVRFEDDWDALDSDAVVITFDDGYRDNLQYALPVLEELQLPATIFVSTDTLGQDKELWWDELERLILVGDDIPDMFQLEDRDFGCCWNTSTWEHRRNCYRSIHYLMKNYINLEKRESWMGQLWDWRGKTRTPRADNLTLSVKDCGELGKSRLISIGAHTISHPSLATLSREEQETEIKTSIDTLSVILGKRIKLFSYPFGKAGIDFDDETIEICHKNGIVKAASTEDVLWEASVSPYKIPRKVARNWDLFEFEAKITEYWGIK